MHDFTQAFRYFYNCKQQRLPLIETIQKITKVIEGQFKELLESLQQQSGNDWSAAISFDVREATEYEEDTLEISVSGYLMRRLVIIRFIDGYDRSMARITTPEQLDLDRDGKNASWRVCENDEVITTLVEIFQRPDVTRAIWEVLSHRRILIGPRASTGA